MPDVKERRYPKWPLRLVLSLVFAVEVLLVVWFSAEGVAENILMIVNSAGILVFCVLTWRGIPWSRWLLIAFLAWRVAIIAVKVVSHMAPGDHRIVGTLILLAIYVVCGLLIASPLGRSSKRAAT